MKYFAYGSNMDPERMSERSVSFSQRTHAILKGYRLDFNKVASRNPQEGYANVVKFENGIVEGVLYEILDSDLSKLDAHEGYPDHYDRVKVKVNLNDGQEVEAVAYIAQPNKVRDGLKPSRDYLDHLLAAKDLLSEAYRRKLEALQPLDEWVNRP
jgi:gamma-glutamylcyclotransferase